MSHCGDNGGSSSSTGSSFIDAYDGCGWFVNSNIVISTATATAASTAMSVRGVVAVVAVGVWLQAKRFTHWVGKVGLREWKRKRCSERVMRERVSNDSVTGLDETFEDSCQSEVIRAKQSRIEQSSMRILQVKVRRVSERENWYLDETDRSRHMQKSISPKSPPNLCISAMHQNQLAI